MKTNSSEFRKLREKWYKKLKKDGFEDIELSSSTEFDDSRPFLKHYHGTKFTLQNTNYLKGLGTNYIVPVLQSLFSERQRYFEKAGQWYHHHEFINVLEKLIWEYHSQGLLAIEITKKLKKTIKESIPYWKITEILRRLTKEFQEDIWNAKI